MTIEQKDLLNFISGGKTTSERGKKFSNLITNLKAEDEKLLLAEREQNQKQANEIKHLQKEIARLKTSCKN